LKNITGLRLVMLSFILLICKSATAETLFGHVIGVHDGDTLTVLDSYQQQHRIRLSGIDAPELKQAYGRASKRHLSDQVFDRDVALDCGKVDRYGRRICVVLVDKRDVNLLQIESGMAWWYQAYAKEQAPGYGQRYEMAEQQAKAGGKGLWTEPSPLPPWEWRRK
jgi:endonuclease YncB( thermonuclease family)